MWRTFRGRIHQTRTKDFSISHIWEMKKLLDCEEDSKDIIPQEGDPTQDHIIIIIISIIIGKTQTAIKKIKPELMT